MSEAAAVAKAEAEQNDLVLAASAIFGDSSNAFKSKALNGKPVVISATLMGSVTNAAGKIVAQRKTATGLEMEMEHYFGRQDGGAIQTKDVGVLTAVPGKDGRYMIEITYDLQPKMSRGTLKGYKGQFKSYGLVDLRDPNNMVGLVRYEGEICK